MVKYKGPVCWGSDNEGLIPFRPLSVVLTRLVKTAFNFMHWKFDFFFPPLLIVQAPQNLDSLHPTQMEELWAYWKYIIAFYFHLLSVANKNIVSQVHLHVKPKLIDNWVSKNIMESEYQQLNVRPLAITAFLTVLGWR
mgnify:CR=1 FL=1